MKRLVLPGIIVLGIVLLLACISGVAKLVFVNRYKAEIAAMKAKGEPTTLTELLGPPVPDDQNAAIPYMQLFLEADAAGHGGDLKTLVDFPLDPGAQIDAATWKAAEKALARTEPLRKLVDQALARPRCRFEVDMKDPVATRHPYLMAMRGLVRSYAVSARLNARSGRMDRAVDDILTQVRMADSVKDEPFLVFYAWKLSRLHTAVESVSAVAEYGALSEDQARRLFNAFRGIDLAESCGRCYQGAMVTLMHYADSKNMGYFLASQAYTAIGNPSAGETISRPLASAYSKTVMKGDLATCIQLTSAQIDGAGLTYPDAKAKGLLDAPRSLPFYTVISRMTLPALSEFTLRRYAVETEITQAEVFLALQAYKARFGGYPATMQELKSKLGWKLPVDPFSEKDFIYKRQTKGFILYSLGPDMKDDGGRSLGDRVQSVNDKGDIVLGWDK